MISKIAFASDIHKLIENISLRYNIDSKIISAIVATESNYDTFTTRFEPKWLHFLTPQYFAKLNKITVETEIIHQQTSWGLGQIMGAVARELDFDKPLTMLCLPEINLDLTCKKVFKLLEKYKYIDAVLASYNAGSLVYRKDGKLINQDYVNKVLAKYGELKNKV